MGFLLTLTAIDYPYLHSCSRRCTELGTAVARPHTAKPRKMLDETADFAVIRCRQGPVGTDSRRILVAAKQNLSRRTSWLYKS